ncbi:[histone H3]-lysine(4) N-trimethyltransferase [Ranunculus cassubicifolius]
MKTFTCEVILQTNRGHVKENNRVEARKSLDLQHKKQKEEDIAICDCKYNACDPDSACGDRCLNFLTSTECTPGYCPCDSSCRNQRFQKCENAKLKLFKTEGRGCGLLADENIKAGQFIIEYCGEVISSKEARKRALAYEVQGLLDAYIISLNASESIDATKKGSLARFINHSCLPNCETRKWTVLGEIRVGIFAMQDIPIGTELGYDYNFEWYGGAKVRCLCGASSCSGFLGAKSRGFQEDTYLWDDNDDRYSVEDIPTYDSAEDEPTSKLLKTSEINSTSIETHVVPLSVKPLNSAAPMEGVVMHNETKAMVPRIQASPSPNKKALKYTRSKNNANKVVDAQRVGQLLVLMEARDEVMNYEESKKEAKMELDSLYDEIRPDIEVHERDSQDSVPTNVAERWIGAHCDKFKADFDLYSSIIKNIAVMSARKSAGSEPNSGKGDDVKLLTN